MDKKELKEDLIRDRIIDSIQYISDKWRYVVGVLLFIIAGISSYSFLSKKEVNRMNLSSEISGLAQNEYNQGDIEFAVQDLETILGDYEDTDGGAQAYIYLIYDAYINDDMSKMESLLDDYSIYSNDELLKASVLETKAYLFLNNSDYSSAIDILNRSLKVNDIETIRIRLEIAKARVYISKKEYDKALTILNELRDYESNSSNQQNTIEELLSYIMHVK